MTLRPPGRNRWTERLRWLVVPMALALFLLTGLAASTEDRQAFSGEQPPDAQQATDERPFGERGQEEQRLPDTEDGDGSNVEVGSPAGSVGFTFGDGDPIARPRPVDGSTPPPTMLPSDPGGPDAYRLSVTGDLQPVAVADIAPGDVVVRAAGGGIDVLRADGTRVEVRPQQEREDSAGAGTGADGALDADADADADDAAGPGTISVRAIGADGAANVALPDASGTIDLGDGVTLRVPLVGAPAAPPQASEQASQPDDGIEPPTGPWRWILLGLAALAAAGLTGALLVRRRGDDDAEPFGPDFVGAGGIPIDRFDEFVAMLAADDDLARAIRLAFHAAERGMGTLPARHSTETPFEWHERVTSGQHHLGPPLRALCDRFATARFAPTRPSSADRDAVVAELVRLHELARGLTPEPDRPSPATTVGAPR